MRISKNYQMKEFAVSARAAAMQRSFIVPNNLQPNVVALVINLLQPISDATGWANLITSGYRPEWLNKLVDGSATSQHMTAEAADCNFFERRPDGTLGRKIPTHEVMAEVKRLGLPFDQMIGYNTFVHLSYSERRQRGEVLYNRSYTGKRI